MNTVKIKSMIRAVVWEKKTRGPFRLPTMPDRLPSPSGWLPEHIFSLIQ